MWRLEGSTATLLLLLLLVFCLMGNALETSFLERSLAQAHYSKALARLHESLTEAFTSFRESYEYFPTILSAENMVWVLGLMGKENEVALAARQYLHPLDEYVRSESLLLQGISLSTMGDESRGLSYYLEALRVTAHRADVWFHLGTAYTALGDIRQAIHAYQQALACNPIHTRSLINLGSIYHRANLLSAAFEKYDKVVQTIRLARSSVKGYDMLPTDYIKAQGNLVTILYQQGQLQQALGLISSMDHELQRFRDQLAHTRHAEQVDEIAATFACHRLLVQRAAAIWLHREELVAALVKRTLTHKHAKVVLLPFDSLLFDVSLPDKLAIARRAAPSPLLPPSLTDTLPPLPRADDQPMVGRSLRIGMLTADIGNHPTAHLLDGLLRLLSYARTIHPVTVIVLSYGGPNNSSYRHSISTLAQEFVDVSHLSQRGRLREAIVAQGLDALLDMQVATLGHQMDALRGLPASILQMNYLVYPGTSGTSFLQYVFADAVVLPPEHAPFYTERLLLVPPSYQPSHYGSLPAVSLADIPPQVWRDRKRMLRRRYGLPASAVVLCNFNKIDKVDPTSFALWMQVLHRLPHSVLWMLHHEHTASQEIPTQLRRAMAHFGIRPQRLLLAGWTDKNEHVARHLAADLFVDTLVYSAHSTATDALFGGLPVLTLQGDSFANRVGASLLSGLSGGDGLWASLLVVHSVKDYVDVAVRLGSFLRHAGTYLQCSLLTHLRQTQITPLPPDGPPPSPSAQRRDMRHAHHFVAAMQASYEARPWTQQCPARCHLVILSEAATALHRPH